MKTKRLLWISIPVLLFIGTIHTGDILIRYYSFADEIVTPQIYKNSEGDSLKVIFIGDSWASYHSQYDQYLKSCLEKKVNKPTLVISRGTVGAKAKTIYANMHADSPSGTKELIGLSPDYAIISAGINDAVAKMGTKNYCHHYNLIINELLSAGIKPIILDMPQVDYMAIFHRESLADQIRHRISSWITDAPFGTFDNYRAALLSMIKQDSLETHVIYIPASDWNPEGYADSRILYREDHVHLNEKGYLLLDSCIASYIYEDYKITHGFQ